MSRDPLVERKTALSYKTREKTVLRGYNLSDLAEEGYSFSEAGTLGKTPPGLGSIARTAAPRGCPGGSRKGTGLHPERRW